MPDPERGQASQAAACPICGKPPEPRFRPFCSRRCADIDLGRWFTEGYAVPATAAESEDAELPRGDDDENAG